MTCEYETFYILPLMSISYLLGLTSYHLLQARDMGATKATRLLRRRATCLQRPDGPCHVVFMQVQEKVLPHVLLLLLLLSLLGETKAAAQHSCHMLSHVVTLELQWDMVRDTVKALREC